MKESLCDISSSLNSLSSEQQEFSFKELKLFLELYASFVTLVGNVMEFLDELISLLYCKEELGGLSPLKEMEHQIEWKLKALEDNGMNAYMEEALNNKVEEFEGQERPSKLFTMYSIVNDQSREQFGIVEAKKSSIEVLHEGGDLGKDLDPIPRSKEDSHQSTSQHIAKIGVNFPTWAKGLSTIYQGEFSISNLFKTLGYCPIKYWTSKFKSHKILDIKI
ncbi:hypothetical protein M9H77_17218 [Catharanthus roseus]|uniref:Uncharacterized protein n=1 Tax=Catharanthus roseus TaxID=4058 RepID=A0ACC0B3Z8_CATRO|nr:hypothetical protein M9H77_17218 [Catharanthus roseus]